MTVADLVKAYRTGPARLQRSDAWAPTPLEHAGMYVYLKGLDEARAEAARTDATYHDDSEPCGGPAAFWCEVRRILGAAT